MKRVNVVGVGDPATTAIYTVLVSPEDDARMFNYYPTLAGETETYLQAKAAELGLAMDGQPLVRFIADDQLKRGKYDVVAELVAAQIVERLRADEMARYGIASPRSARQPRGARPGAQGARAPMAGAAAAGAAGVAGAAAGAGGNMQPIRHASSRPVSRPAPGPEDIYDPEYDEINSANIAEPDWEAPEPIPAAAYAQPAGADFAPEPAYAAKPAADPEPQNMAPKPPPPEGTPREVYLYDEARDCAYQLTGQAERMGRESSNSIVIPDINASRVHAEIRCEPTGAWVITDLGSLNGVFVNGRRIKSAPLRDADMIRIGTTELEFQDLEQ